MTKRLIYIWVLVAFTSISTNAQVADTTLLSYIDFYTLLIKNHPVVKMAGLEVDYAQADLLMARGGFDPKLESNFDRKSIGGQDYYNHWISQLKVPIWAGIDFKVEREQNTGDRLNPELSALQTFTGFSVPVGKGLLMENRRSTLLQSKIYQNISVAEQRKMVNKIVFAGAKDYWEWYLKYQALKIQSEAYELAKNRFQFVKSQAQVGEKAPIDSVEAKITLQTREVDVQNALIDFRNSSLILSNYLWDQNDVPLEIPENFIPPSIPSFILNEEKLNLFVEQAKNNHPEITKLNFKYEQIQVQERLAKEAFKPQLDLSFGYLDTPKYSFGDYSLLNSNHKLGVDFSIPLFLRKERGKLQQVKIKQISNELERRQLSREILNDVYIAYNQAKNLENVISIQGEAAEMQQVLLDAEKMKFSIGESSLFLINSRENKLLEIKLKLEELKSKYEKAVASLVYAAGLDTIN
ncbi:Outer membrane protein TolC [Spirosomataceae bacterium TFI 002]|nr:Outer membrane protein TolC [Spirosomataceae bacterium TFI 002]